MRLTALVDGIADLLARSVGPSIAIHTSLAPDLKPVMADSQQLELALLNLVMNARDASPDGGRIVVAAHEERIVNPQRPGDPPENHVSLSVTDAGVGMDADTLARAMEPFFTTKGVGKGTGLGLSMVHGLAKQSGGWFALESRPGGGTTASIWLPAAGLEAAGDASGPPVAVAVDNPSRPLRIVAVDDDNLVLMNTAAMLEELGHTVVEATSGLDALRVLDASDDVDLVVTDQAMPGMTGTQLIDAVRSRWPRLPFVLVSGYAEFPEGTDAAIPRVKKPFVQSDLARAVAAATVPAAG